MPLIARLTIALMLAGGSGLALAQDKAGPVPTAPPGAAAKLNAGEPPEPDVAPLSLLPGPATGPAAPQAAQRHRLTLEGRLTEKGKALASGLVWRVFGTKPGQDGKLPLLRTQHGGSASLELPTGEYFVHVAFGRAGATKRVSVGGAETTESLVLNAGGLRLDAVVGDQQPAALDRLTFEILRENEQGEIAVVVPKAQPGHVLRLAAGTYHVVSRYGTLNAVVRADIVVEAGKLTEAVLRQSGAEVTLKLVSDGGGEALANTSWSVVNDSGETVHQAVGAFPSIILAEGTYTAVAKHDGQIYSRDFNVESGVDHDIEVRLSDRIEPDAEAPAIADRPMLQAKPRFAIRRTPLPAAPIAPDAAAAAGEAGVATGDAAGDAGPVNAGTDSD